MLLVIRGSSDAEKAGSVNSCGSLSPLAEFGQLRAAFITCEDPDLHPGVPLYRVLLEPGRSDLI